MQEAEHFVLYASMPFSMISNLNLPDRRGAAIAYLTETFHFPVNIAEKRLDQIQRRVVQGMWDDIAKDYEDKMHHFEPTWSAETMRIIKQLDRQLLAEGKLRRSRLKKRQGLLSKRKRHKALYFTAE
ncbi:hypothetical protein D3C74_292430 [compost metagenome]